MASFPHQAGQMQYPAYIMPTSEAMPSQIIFDPSRAPTFQGTGPCGVPYNSSVGYHSCCNHMPFPGHYGYGSSVPHPYPPQPYPWWGSYPAYPHAMPFHFAPPPPPYYAADISRFEHHKDMVEPQNNHRCGYPNHVCRPWDQPGVKIEEQDPSIVKDKDLSEGGVQSFVTSDFKNCPYPIIWIPPEYIRNLEQKKPSMPKIVDTEDTPMDVSHKASSGRSLLPAANIENRCIRMPSKDSQTESHQQIVDKGKDFSYPIVWIPYANQEENVRDDKSASPGAPSLVLPSDKISRSKESMPDGECRGKIEQHLVKQHPEEKMAVKNEESTAGNIQQSDARKMLGNVCEKGEDTKGEGSKGRKSPGSPTEKVKLPPVCLRVDPLPRKKNTNRTLRSPSPQEARKSATSGGKDAREGNEPGLANDKMSNPPVKRKEVKVIEVKDSPTGEEKVKISSSITKEDRGCCEDSGKEPENHETGDIPKKKKVPTARVLWHGGLSA